MLWVKLLALHWNGQKCSLIPAPYHLSIANYCLAIWFAWRQSAAVDGAYLGKQKLPGRSKLGAARWPRVTVGMAGKLGHMSGLRQAFWMLSLMVCQTPRKALNSHGPQRAAVQCEIQDWNKTEYTEYTRVVGSNLYITSNYFTSKKALEAVCTLRE